MDIVIIHERNKESFYSEVKKYVSQGYEIKWGSFNCYYSGNIQYKILAVKGEEKKKKFSRRKP